MPRRLPEKSRFEVRKKKSFGRPYLFRTVQPSPVKEGEEYDIVIDDIGSKGDGIGKIQGFRVYVPETKIGDRVKVKIVSVGGNFAIAKRIE
jgi:predicted RNA-binding protein with TRAM domain